MSKLYNELMDLVMDDNTNLLQEATIVEKDKYKIAIYGDGDTDRGFANTPYVKYFKGSDPNHAEQLLRISLLKPEIIEHEGNHWKKFGKDDIKRFISMMEATPKSKYKVSIDGHENENNYQVLLGKIKEYAKSEVEIDYNKEMPSYKELKPGNY